MENACLCEFTKVHVKPFHSNPSDHGKTSSRDVSGIPPESFAYRMKNLFSNLAPRPFVFGIQDYCGDVLNKTTARVLPEMLINDVFVEELDILAVFRLNFSMFFFFVVINDFIIAEIIFITMNQTKMENFNT